jgi:Putative transposase
VPVRQWVLSFPIPLAHPVGRPSAAALRRCCKSFIGSSATFLIKQAGLKRCEAHTGAVTRIQRFGSAANLNIHLHCLVLDGVDQRTEHGPLFQEARAPSREQLADLLAKIIRASDAAADSSRRPR